VSHIKTVLQSLTVLINLIEPNHHLSCYSCITASFEVDMFSSGYFYE